MEKRREDCEKRREDCENEVGIELRYEPEEVFGLGRGGGEVEWLV